MKEEDDVSRLALVTMDLSKYWWNSLKWWLRNALEEKIPFDQTFKAQD